MKILLASSTLALSTLVCLASADEYNVSSTIVGYSGGGFGGHVTLQTTIAGHFPVFDANLGTLTEVKVHADITGAADLTMFHIDDFGNYATPLSGSFRYRTWAGLAVEATAGGAYGTTGVDLGSGFLQKSTSDTVLNFHADYQGTLDFGFTQPSSDFSNPPFSDPATGVLMWIDTISQLEGHLDGYQPDDLFNYWPVSSNPTAKLTVTYVYRPVPEPASLLGLGTGLMALCRTARRSGRGAW